MQDDTAIIALSNQLNHARASRRQAKLRIEQIELEARQLTAQIQEDDLTSDRTQAALRALLGDSVQESRPATRYVPDEGSARNLENQIRQPRPSRSTKPAIHRDVEIKSTRFSELKIPQAAMILLRESGGPMHVNQLYNLMLENGFHFGGDNHLISLAVSLNRNPRFRKVGPGTFDLVMRDAGQVA
jgi:hypothetical protein